MRENLFNLIIAILLSVGIIFGWRYFYENPKLEEAQKIAAERATLEAEKAEKPDFAERGESISSGNRIKIKSDSLSGSFSPKGLRFDDLVLLKYKKDISQNSSKVDLLSPSNVKESYFAEIGWIGGEDFPSENTEWKIEGDSIEPGKSLELKWVNKAGVEFSVSLSLDENYMFSIVQRTLNKSRNPISLRYYGLINKIYGSEEKAVNILHQGPMGSINGELQEYSYDSLKDKKTKKFYDSTLSWLGISDKYWLTAFAPDPSGQYDASFNYLNSYKGEKFQVDFVGKEKILKAGATSESTLRFFAGAKKVDLLDKYETKYGISLFDRAIDFGWFYPITKPVFYAMNFFYSYVGNFGISILIVTIIIKTLMFTLANKSYRSMKKMKKLQPDIERIKTLYAEDKVRLNQEIMALYKREKVNPLSGCLPLLVQIPVFFSIYKVLYVTIEMRQAPFYGWVKDLSAPDPTSIFNLFGLLPFAAPSFLSIGAWPIIMAVSMYLQQRMSPEPADPTQAMAMKLMPIFFLFMFSGFPVGLLIYWSWNNILSIGQQYYINKLGRDV